MLIFAYGGGVMLVGCAHLRAGWTVCHIGVCQMLFFVLLHPQMCWCACKGMFALAWAHGVKRA